MNENNSQLYVGSGCGCGPNNSTTLSEIEDATQCFLDSVLQTCLQLVMTAYVIAHAFDFLFKSILYVQFFSCSGFEKKDLRFI